MEEERTENPPESHNDVLHTQKTAEEEKKAACDLSSEVL